MDPIEFEWTLAAPASQMLSLLIKTSHIAGELILILLLYHQLQFLHFFPQISI